LRRNDLGAGLTNGESKDGGFDEFPAVLPQLPPQLGNLSPQFGHHRTQPTDHLPQLGVLRNRVLIGRTRIGRHTTVINRKPRKINQTRRTEPDAMTSYTAVTLLSFIRFAVGHSSGTRHLHTRRPFSRWTATSTYGETMIAAGGSPIESQKLWRITGVQSVTGVA
jgi:hypothetical protein